MQVTRLESNPQVGFTRPTKTLEPIYILKELIGNTVISFGRGAKHNLQKQRKAFDIWKVIGGEVFNLTGNINESKGKGITIILFQRSKNPILFDGTPLLLEPKVRHGEGRIDRVNMPYEEKLESTGVIGEYKVTFSRLSYDSYKLKVGDPNLDIYGNPRTE